MRFAQLTSLGFLLDSLVGWNEMPPEVHICHCSISLEQQIPPRMSTKLQRV